MSFNTHAQPFTLEEARGLEVSIIVAEISRLQNSLAHLQSTQADLLEALEGEEDGDLRSAFEENRGVIASQEERIRMLRHVLAEKVGEESLRHYGISANGERPGEPTSAPATRPAPMTTSLEEDEGMHL